MFQKFNPFSRSKRSSKENRRHSRNRHVSLEELGINSANNIEDNLDEDSLSTDTLESQLQTTQVSMELVEDILQSNQNVTLLDVRSKSEYDNGHIPGAINIPFEELTEQAATVLEDISARIFVYSQESKRCARACRILSYLGYTNITSIGSIINWTGRLESSN